MDGFLSLPQEPPCVNDLPHSVQITLCLIANHCSKYGYCFAFNKTLAEKRKLSLAQIKRHITILIEAGFLTCRHIGHDRRLYLNVPAESLKCATNEPLRITKATKGTKAKNTYVIPNENSEETNTLQAEVVTDAEEDNLRGVLTPVGTETTQEQVSRLEEEGSVVARTLRRLREHCVDCANSLPVQTVEPTRAVESPATPAVVAQNGNSRETKDSIPHTPAATEATQAQTTLIEIERDNAHDGGRGVCGEKGSHTPEKPDDSNGVVGKGTGAIGERGGTIRCRPIPADGAGGDRAQSASTLDTLIEIERSNEHDGIRESASTRAGDAGHHVRTQGIRTDVNRRQGVIPRAADRASDIPPRQPVCQKGNLRGAVEAGVSGVESGALETLIEIGVSPGEASRLVAQFESAHIARCVAAYLQEKARGKARGVGWLCKAVCSGWSVKLLDMSPQAIAKRRERLRVREMATVEYGGVKPDMAYLRSRLGGVGV